MDLSISHQQQLIFVVCCFLKYQYCFDLFCHLFDENLLFDLFQIVCEPELLLQMK